MPVTRRRTQADCQGRHPCHRAAASARSDSLNISPRAARWVVCPLGRARRQAVTPGAAARPGPGPRPRQRRRGDRRDSWQSPGVGWRHRDRRTVTPASLELTVTMTPSHESESVPQARRPGSQAAANLGFNRRVTSHAVPVPSPPLATLT